ncbi:MAG: IclR family transcriptional regulator [Halolamina sp.]
MEIGETTATLTTTERSLEVAELAREREGVTLGDVQDALGMAKSTAYKHLRTLERRGYLTKEGSQYHVGLRFLNLGEYALSWKDGYRLAGNAVDALADRTGEEVDFFVESAAKAISVQVSYDASNPFTDEVVDASENLWRVGTLYDMHSMAGGKAILSGFSDDEIRAIADRHGLRATTDRTITDVDELLAEVATIRETGLAVSQEEYAPGLCAVGRRVDNPDGSVFGALAVNVPRYRFDGARPEVEEALADAAEALENALANAENG